jgi:hypothetical protein
MQQVINPFITEPTMVAELNGNTACLYLGHSAKLT